VYPVDPLTSDWFFAGRTRLSAAAAVGIVSPICSDNRAGSQIRSPEKSWSILKGLWRFPIEGIDFVGADVARSDEGIVGSRREPVGHPRYVPQGRERSVFRSRKRTLDQNEGSPLFT